MTTPPSPAAPDHECPLCPRLASFRADNRAAYPDWHNGPVESFGDLDAPLLIVGLAPGLRGANRTGRPFTGDFAGDLLYATLKNFGLARGDYDKRPDDGLGLIDCRVTNGVRCVPPENKPTGTEIAQCRPFLQAEIAQMTNLRIILALGSIAHNTVVTALGERPAHWKFGHARIHRLPDGPTVADSYHCSRYNTNTGRLTERMFHAVFDQILTELNAP